MGGSKNEQILPQQIMIASSPPRVQGSGFTPPQLLLSSTCEDDLSLSVSSRGHIFSTKLSWLHQQRVINWYFIQTYPSHSIYQDERLFPCSAPHIKHKFPKDRVCVYSLSELSWTQHFFMDECDKLDFLQHYSVAQPLCNITQRLQVNYGPSSSQKHECEKGLHSLGAKIKSPPYFQNPSAKNSVQKIPVFF